MLRVFIYLTITILVVNGLADTKEKTEATTTTEDKPKETSEPAIGVNEDSEKQSKNSTEKLTADEKMKGFLKLYNFAIKHGKLNLTETLKNLTSLNDTVSLSNFSKAVSNTGVNGTTLKLPVKTGAKITSPPKKEAAGEDGSGEENDGKKGKGKHNSEELPETWDEDDVNDNGNNNYNYHDEYEGGNGHGYEYTNDNGDINGHGYQFQYDNSPGMGGISNQPISMEASPEIEAGGFPQDSFDSEFSPHGASDVTGGGHTFESENPTGYNQQGFVNFDDGTSQYLNNENYDKKKHIHKLKKGNKRHHKLHPKLIHLHTIAKHHHTASKEARKLVTAKKQQIEHNGYRRTIMIGNRVCGAKKSTNVQTRTEIQDNDERDDNMVKREMKGRRDTKQHIEDSGAVQATDQCCADHYECQRIVPAKSTKFGYTNDIEYDVMACSCDSKFRNCLKNANSYTADAVGHLYFNTLKIPCLTFEHEPAEQKSEQPQTPQETSNIVSIVPDAETDRETVGGAQLVVSPPGSLRTGDHRTKEVENEQVRDVPLQTERVEREDMTSTSNELLKEAQQQAHTQDLLKGTHHHVHTQKAVFHVYKEKNGKEEEEVEESQQQQLQRKNRRPEVINPNPSPNNLNKFNQKVRGIVVTAQEAYSPKVGFPQ